MNAFEAALHAFDESACASPGHSTRRMLARYVIERALTGERDLEALRDGALRYVKSGGSHKPPEATR